MCLKVPEISLAMEDEIKLPCMTGGHTVFDCRIGIGRPHIERRDILFRLLHLNSPCRRRRSCGG